MPQTIQKEIAKHIYYSFIVPVLVIFLVYYFNYYQQIIDNIQFFLIIILLISICLLILYVLNTVYLIIRISKSYKSKKKDLNINLNRIENAILSDEQKSPHENVCELNYII